MFSNCFESIPLVSGTNKYDIPDDRDVTNGWIEDKKDTYGKEANQSTGEERSPDVTQRKQRRKYLEIED